MKDLITVKKKESFNNKRTAYIVTLSLFCAVCLPAYGMDEMKRLETAFHPIMVRAAREHSVEVELIKAIVMVESRFNSRAISPKGARGLMQLMPTTAKSLSVRDSFDPEQNINAGVRYLKGLIKQFNGDIVLALAAYNAGPSQVRKHGGIPNFVGTKRYIKRVMKFYHLNKKRKGPKPTDSDTPFPPKH